MIYTGIVENVHDPLLADRVQVRIHGLHTADKNELPTADLPWALVQGDVTDAAISGIGKSSHGLLQGTAVTLDFLDPQQQQPIVTGTLKGIPQRDPFSTLGSNELSILGDGAAPQPAAPLPPVSPPAFSAPINSVSTLGVGHPSDMTISQAGVSLIKGYENFEPSAYQDSVGVWTIGYGSTIVDGAPVVPGQTITQEKATQVFTQWLQTTTVPAVQAVRAPLTQQMFDACCSLAYNIGTGSDGFGGSTLKSVLDAGRYQEAAEHFMDWDEGHVDGVLQVIPGLRNRRASEQSYFLSGGVPNAATGTVTPPSSGVTPPSGSTAPFTPGVSNNVTQQTPFRVQSLGFQDPDGKWPAYYNEPDTHRLARAQQLGGTLLYRKVASRVTGVPVSPGGATWDQPNVPYATIYPFNKVYASESGHVMEFDDTPHAERLHLYHRTGTFSEIDCNGTRVQRIVGDGYEILERNGYVYIRGNANVTVDGSQNVYIKNSHNLFVDGDVALSCAGNLTHSVRGTYAIQAAAITMESTSGNIDMKSAAEMNRRASSTINDDGSEHYSQSGTSTFSGPTLTVPAAANNPVPTFPALSVPTVSLVALQNYDEPDSGDPTAFLQNQVAIGNVPSSVLKSNDSITVGPATTPTSTASGTTVDCSHIANLASYPPSLQISPNFTMGTYTKNGSRPLVQQQGLTPSQIAYNITQHCNNITEKVYAAYPTMMVTSGFRRPGDVPASAPRSQHYLGQAADFFFPSADRPRLLAIAQDLAVKLDYDQLLLESLHGDTGWIHISYNPAGNRKQCLTLHNNRVVAQGLALVTDNT